MAKTKDCESRVGGAHAPAPNGFSEGHLQTPAKGGCPPLDSPLTRCLLRDDVSSFEKISHGDGYQHNCSITNAAGDRIFGPPLAGSVGRIAPS